ncbi:hypothetical protein [Actinokineospora sp.]|uniref:hypothetical protein n=1 Tax=Actinokineospora sp. TaxID=1872133 RepID=UPI0040377138
MIGDLTDRAGTAGLTLLAAARWPETEAPTPIPGFVVSTFSPLVAAVADRCLRTYFGDPPADPAHGGRTAVVVSSVDGDVATAAAVAKAVDNGSRVSALLFYQSVPNSVAGHIAAKWGLAGPLVCTSPTADALDDMFDLAALLFDDGDAAHALLVLAGSGTGSGSGPGDDETVAVLVTRFDSEYLKGDDNEWQESSRTTR